MDLIEVNKDNKKAQRTDPGADYVPHHPLTRLWEVPRHHVTIEKNHCKGAFGQVAKGTAVGLRGSPETTTEAIKMLKGELLYRKLNESLGLQPFRKCCRVTVFFLAICHFITSVIISEFCIISPLTKFNFFFNAPANAIESDKRDLMKELDTMKQLKPHPYVIKLLGCVTESGMLWLSDLLRNTFSSMEESLLHN